MSAKKPTVLAIYPDFVLFRFCAETSPALVEIQILSRSDIANAEIVSEAFGQTKMSFQEECTNVVSQSALLSGENRVVKVKSWKSSKRFFYAVKKPVLLLRNVSLLMLTQLELRNIGEVINSLLSTFRQSHAVESGCQTTSFTFFEKSSQTERKNELESKETQTSSQNYEEMQTEILNLKGAIQSLENKLKISEEVLARSKIEHQKEVRDLLKENNNLTNTVVAMEGELKSAKEELRETFLDLGRVSVENTRMVNEMKKDTEFNKTYASKSEKRTTTKASEASTSTQALSFKNGENTAESCHKEKQQPIAEVMGKDCRESFGAVSVQETEEGSSSKDGISLTNIPNSAVEKSVYNNYKMLLIIIASSLLSSDVAKFKEWASTKCSVNVTSNILDILLEMDRKRVISALNLQDLREFFSQNVRIDIVHLIDCFLSGDYAYLRKFRSTRLDGIIRTNPLATSNDVSSGAAFRSSCSSNPQSFEMEESTTQPKLQDSPTQTNSFANSKADAPQPTNEQVVKHETRPQHEIKSSKTCINMTSILSKQSNGASSRSQRTQIDMGSNGNKLSKFQHTKDTKDELDDHGEWLCSHYKRRCYVKFSCCNEYWPCHRCHNNESQCGGKRLKSRDTKFVRCLNCGTQQPFSEKSQFCTKCHMKFSEYFCHICKHLTGTDDNPYHCKKCGICRIYSDRSFHCDVCGVCLDVQLRGNHKCRAGSAHDECCICLEDAFSGCQILPCSHKVHKECATQMIRSGITHCPICRESFAHKLEKRYLPSSKKQHGNK